MISFWERQSFTRYDYIVIGGGIVGLSTAISIKEADPLASVLVLERGILPTGASTKNTGFACFGSLTEILSDIGTMGESASFALVEERLLGLSKLRKRLGDKSIGYKNYGGYELISEKEQPALEHLEAVNMMLHPLFKDKVFHEKPALIKTFKFDPIYTKSLVFNPFEGQIDTGEMMNKLISYAAFLNIRMYTGAEVTEIFDDKEVEIKVSNFTTNSQLTLHGRKVAVCTNAFTSKIYPDSNIKPARGMVLVTKPISNLPFKGTFHMDEGFYYFRNYNSRIIFGGGRNLDFETETTTDFQINDKIFNVLRQKLSTLIIPTLTYEIDMSWAGIMAFGPDKQPVIKYLSPNVVAGVGLGGMGVAIGTNVGEKLCKMLVE